METQTGNSEDKDVRILYHVIMYNVGMSVAKLKLKPGLRDYRLSRRMQSPAPSPLRD